VQCLCNLWLLLLLLPLLLLLVPAITGAPFWGHVVSQDLVRWSWLPPALLPDQTYDRGGVWSGSATIDNEGTATQL
jgi:beta-fructofuranosidase